MESEGEGKQDFYKISDQQTPQQLDRQGEKATQNRSAAQNLSCTFGNNDMLDEEQNDEKNKTYTYFSEEKQQSKLPSIIK
jgi:hypothetical protein